jgi:hypothetical protein
MDTSLAHARPAVGLDRISLPRFVLLATAVFLFTGFGSLLAWLSTGKAECATTFFTGPGTLYLLFLTGFEFSLCRIVVRQFKPGEPLRPTWFLMMVSAGCHVVSTICMQVLSVRSPVNPLSFRISPAMAADLYHFGVLVGGPVQMLLLAGGLGWLLHLFRQSGMPPAFRWQDVIPLMIAGILTYLQISTLVAASRAGNVPGIYDLMCASSGPLLIILMLQATLVRNCMSVLNGGMIARCWSSFAVAILLTALSNLGLTLNSMGMLSAAPATISRFICYLAAMAYALGPAWQIEAIQSACGKIGVPRFSPVASWLSALRLLNTRAQ